MTTSFSINFDYRCPFARNANEHVIAALRAGAPFDVTFRSFSLTEIHMEDGGPSAFDLPDRRPELMAVAAGVAVRDRYPDQFFDAHLSLFALRHDDGDDLRDDGKVRQALQRVGVDADAVFDDLASGGPYKQLREEHESSVRDLKVFGVPTFVMGDEAVFVRLMTRPNGDGQLATDTISRVVELLENNPELNEYKHTTTKR